jgi:hypothetical protein
LTAGLSRGRPASVGIGDSLSRFWTLTSARLGRALGHDSTPTGRAERQRLDPILEGRDDGFMRVMKRVAAALVLAFLVLAVVAFLLPRQVHVERSVAISAPRATVFALVNGLRRFNDFSPWAALDPKTVYTFSGPEAGVGAKMLWTGDPRKVGSGTQEVIESRPFEAVAMALDFGPEGRATTRFALRRVGDLTNVTWSFDTDLGLNPVSRYFGLVFDRTIGRDFEKGLAKLKAIAEGLPKADFEEPPVR